MRGIPVSRLKAIVFATTSPSYFSLNTSAMRSSRLTIYAQSRMNVHSDNASGPKEYVNLKFKGKDGVKEVKAEVGDHILSVAHKNDVDLEGACEASLACSTCHVILPKEVYDKLPQPSVEEEDMLDLAFGLTNTSRLGCQVFVTKDLEGVEIVLPEATRNFYVDESARTLIREK